MSRPRNTLQYGLPIVILCTLVFTAAAQSSAPAYNNRGNKFLANGETEKAIGDYDAAIAFNPENAVTYYNRGNARREKGDIEGALQDRKSTRLNSSHTDISR